MSQSFTSHLLSTRDSAFKSATESPFLRAAGQGQISKAKLSEWVSQDRLYAQAYIGFMGSLLARVRLPDQVVNAEDRKKSSLEWRIVDMLTGALDNIHRELKFFADVAHNFGLELEFKLQVGPDASVVFGPNSVTREYVELFHSFQTEPAKGLLEGMVVLWGTEKCYLSAWMYARSCSSTGPDLQSGKREDEKEFDEDQDGGALRKEFIPNWTSSEFEQFVEELAGLTDELAEKSASEAERKTCSDTWSRVLDIEKRFWPEL